MCAVRKAIISIVSTAALIAGGANAEEGTRWKVDRSKDKLRGTPIVVVSQTSTDTVEMADGRKISGELVFRCRDNTTSVMVFFKLPVGLYYTPISYRIDDKPVVSTTWHSGTTLGTVGIFSGVNAIPFIKGLVGGKALIIRAQPRGALETTFTFSLEGLSEAIEPVRQTCAWDGPSKTSALNTDDVIADAYLVGAAPIPHTYRPYIGSYTPTYMPPAYIPSYRPSYTPSYRPYIPSYRRYR
jgi:type VI secretion system VasI family protein